MKEQTPRVAVTPPAFCRSKSLRTELSSYFPNSIYNEKERYLSDDELSSFLAEADAALIGRDPIDSGLIKSLPNLRMISKYGVGMENLDQEALNRSGI